MNANLGVRSRPRPLGPGHRPGKGCRPARPTLELELGPSGPGRPGWASHVAQRTPGHLTRFRRSGRCRQGPGCAGRVIAPPRHAVPLDGRPNKGEVAGRVIE